MASFVQSREGGKSNSLARVLAAYLAHVPNARISISGKGSERIIEELPENLRTHVVLVPSLPRQEPACHRCGVRSRMALEFCKVCGFNVYSDILSGSERYPEAAELNRRDERIDATRTRARQDQQEANQKSNFTVVEPGEDVAKLAAVQQVAEQAIIFAEVWKQEIQRVVDIETLDCIKEATGRQAALGARTTEPNSEQ